MVGDTGSERRLTAGGGVNRPFEELLEECGEPRRLRLVRHCTVRRFTVLTCHVCFLRPSRR